MRKIVKIYDHSNKEYEELKKENTLLKVESSNKLAIIEGYSNTVKKQEDEINRLQNSLNVAREEKRGIKKELIEEEEESIDSGKVHEKNKGFKTMTIESENIALKRELNSLKNINIRQHDEIFKLLNEKKEYFTDIKEFKKGIEKELIEEQQSTDFGKCIQKIKETVSDYVNLEIEKTY